MEEEKDEAVSDWTADADSSRAKAVVHAKKPKGVEGFDERGCTEVVVASEDEALEVLARSQAAQLRPTRSGRSPRRSRSGGGPIVVRTLRTCPGKRKRRRERGG